MAGFDLKIDIRKKIGYTQKKEDLWLLVTECTVTIYGGSLPFTEQLRISAKDQEDMS